MINLKMTILLMVDVLLTLSNPARVYAYHLDDGQIHNISWPINGDLEVEDDSPFVTPTTVNLLSGSLISGSLHSYGHSRINMSDGTIDSYFEVHDNSQVNISGGMIGGLLHSWDNSQVIVSGGMIGGLIEVGSSPYVDSTLTFIGRDFAINGTSVGYGEYSIIGGTITGTLANGDKLNNICEIYGDSSVILEPITEPNHILTIDVDPNDIGIDTITPSVGAHDYAGRVNIKAQQFAKCPDVYVFDHWEGDVNDPNSANTTVFMDTDKTVTAVFVDGRQCGDECHPYPIGDLDKDCEVTFGDFALFASHWLDCTKPECD